MALKKVITTPAGFTAEYWRVDPNVIVNFADGVAVGKVLLYVSADARKDKTPVPMPPQYRGAINASMTITGADFEAAIATKDLRGALYAKLKKTALFSDATDC